MTTNPFQAVTSRRNLLRAGTTGAITLMSGALAQAISTTPTATEGPFWEDENLNRSDVRSDYATGVVEAGLPLYLTVSVSRLANGAATPLASAKVDIWHCNGYGAYSDEPAGMGNPNTLGKTYLRGYQSTNSRGMTNFTTIYPGWYSGRTPHIHARVRTYSGTTVTLNMTTQFFFTESITTYVYANYAPYNTRGARDTTNTTDNVYAVVSGGGSQLLLRQSAAGAVNAVASFNIVVA
jgi:protocatechuate 3,4-dioxygenase beta subunit